MVLDSDTTVTAQINMDFETTVQQLDIWLERDRTLATPRFPERTSLALPPGEVIGCLLRHRVRFILFGGLAAMFHGWPGPTSDVDVMPDLRKDNRLAIWQAALELTAKRRHELASGADPSYPPAPLDIHDFGLDVIFNPFYPEVGGYYEVLRSSVACTISSGTFHVASPENVIKSMTIAGRPKDQETLAELACLR